MSSLALRTVKDWKYDDIAARAREAAEKATAALVPMPPPGLTEEQVRARVQAALAEAEARWNTQADADESARAGAMIKAMESFADERAAYFRRVEPELVQLSLAIARKILEREAELDPTLLSGLVRIALDRMGAGSAVRLRVPPAQLSRWQTNHEWERSRYQLEVAEDDTLQAGDCFVETDLGSANFGFEAQMKEIEAGLLGILAQRPDGILAQRPDPSSSPGAEIKLRSGA